MFIPLISTHNERFIVKYGKEIFVVPVIAMNFMRFKFFFVSLVRAGGPESLWIRHWSGLILRNQINVSLRGILIESW